MKSFSKFGFVGLITVAMAGLLLLAGATSASTIQLTKEMPVQVRFPADIKVSSGEFGEGQEIPIVLHQPVIKNGQVIVEAGANGTARVVEVTPAGRGGKGGKIKVEFVGLNPKGQFVLDRGAGDFIPLLGEPIEAEGGGKGIIPWLFLKFILKGSQAEIDTDEVYDVKIAKSVMMTDDF